MSECLLDLKLRKSLARHMCALCAALVIGRHHVELCLVSQWFGHGSLRQRFFYSPFRISLSINIIIKTIAMENFCMVDIETLSYAMRMR